MSLSTSAFRNRTRESRVCLSSVIVLSISGRGLDLCAMCILMVLAGDCAMLPPPGSYFRGSHRSSLVMSTGMRVRSSSSVGVRTRRTASAPCMCSWSLRPGSSSIWGEPPCCGALSETPRPWSRIWYLLRRVGPPSFSTASWTRIIISSPSDKATMAHAVPIGRALAVKQRSSKPTTLARRELVDVTAHPVPTTQVSAPPSTIAR